MINNSENLKEARIEIMKKIDFLKNKFGIVIESDGKVGSKKIIHITEGLEYFAQKDYKKFMEVTNKAMRDFLSGDLGEYEKYEEDVYNLSQSNIKGRYKLDFKINTRFGECDTLCVTPTEYGITLHMAMED